MIAAGLLRPRRTSRYDVPAAKQARINARPRELRAPDALAAAAQPPPLRGV